MGPGKSWVQTLPELVCADAQEQVWMVKTCENLGVFMVFNSIYSMHLETPSFFQLGSSGVTASDSAPKGLCSFSGSHFAGSKLANWDRIWLCLMMFDKQPTESELNPKLNVSVFTCNQWDFLPKKRETTHFAYHRCHGAQTPCDWGTRGWYSAILGA